MFTVKFPVVVVVYVATSLVSKDKYKKALSDRAGPQGMLAALPRSLAGFKGAASRHERTGKGIQERNKRGERQLSPYHRSSCLSCCWSKGVEWPAKRCYVGLVAVGVQEQAEDILVPPPLLLRNC